MAAAVSARTLTLEACTQLLLIRRRLYILHDRQLAWKRADVAAKAAARKREWLAQRAAKQHHYGDHAGGGAGNKKPAKGVVCS